MEFVPLLGLLVLDVDLEGGGGEEGGAQLEHVDVQVLDSGESDWGGHGAMAEGLAVTEVQALWRGRGIEGGRGGHGVMTG